MEYVNSQLSSFFILLMSGLLLGGLLDLYRVMRSRIRVNWFTTMAGDLFFWLGALILLTPLIFWGTWLELRLYVWLTLGMGIGLYFWAFSALCIPIFLKFWRMLTWLPRHIKLLNQKLLLMLRKSRFSKRTRSNYSSPLKKHKEN